jgi:hypothetical protein
MITIEKWSGLVTAASPYALPGGAMVEQINLQCARPGQLEGRSGYVSAAAVSNPIVSAVRYSTGTQDKVFAQVGSQFLVFTP